MYVAVTRIRWFLPVLLAAALCARGEDAPQLRALFDETFAAKSGVWVSQTALATNGELALTCQSDAPYEGVQVVFPPTLKAPPDGEGQLRYQITVAGVTSPNGGYSARFFLAPGPINPWQWVEPYGMPHVLAIYIEGGAETAAITLYAKSGTETGGGRSLYSGGLSAKSFPLTMTLLLDRATYRVQFSDGVETKTGSRSGRHGLDEAKWSGDLGSGLRLVNLTKGNKPAIRLAEVKAAVELAPLAAATDSGTAAAVRRPFTAVVQVHPQVTRSVGGYDQVQALFGGNVNGETRGKADDLVRELNLNTCRIHIFADVFGPPPELQAPVTPSWASQFGIWMGRKPLAPEAVGPAWDKWYREDFASFLNPLISNGAVNATGGQPSQLFQQKVWNANDHVVFLPTHRIDGNGIRNLDGATRFYQQYLDAVSRYAPWLHTEFIQLSNEPNYPWWTGSFAKGQDPVAGWIALYNGVDARLRKTNPATRLLGPCLASCAFFSWGDWQTWTVPVLKGVQSDLEDFNYHNYSTAAQSHLAWMQMLQAQAEALGRKRPRAVVTEMNDSDDIGKAGRKFEWWAEQYFMALDNPDKFHLLSYFLLGVKGTGEAGDVVSSKGGGYEPTDTYWLLWALRQTRGAMRYVEPVGNPDLKVFACAPQDNRLVVSLFNDTGRPAKLTLRSGLHADAKIQSLVRSSAHRQADIVWHAEDTLAPAAEVEVTVPPDAVESYVWTLAEPALKARQSVAQHEFVSRTVNQKFAQAVLAPIDVPRLPDENETVTLRFAVASDDLLAARGLKVEVGGAIQPVAWTEAPREEERGQRSTWWMELPVPRARIARSNRVAFTQADAEYRLMFASMVYYQHPTAKAAAAAEAAALSQRRGGVAVSFPPLGAFLAGDEKPVVLTIENRQDQPATCTVSLSVPAGLTVSGIPASTTFVVPARGRQEVRGTVRAGDVAKIQNLRLVANVEVKGGDVHAYPAAVTLYPKRTAVHFAKPPILDGKLDDWPATDVATAFGSASVQFRAGWDAENLYLAADVKTGKRPGPPANPDHFWEGDVMEVFLDVRNSKSALYEDGDGQFFFCPYGLGQDGAWRNGYFPRVRKGDQVAHGEAVYAGPWQVASAPRDDGYVLECKLPWSVLATNFTPQAGTQIGMDVAIHGCESLFGAEGKPFDSPRQWGILTLK